MKTNPIQIIDNYFERGYCFYKTLPKAPTRPMKPVFLIHGWGVRAASITNLASALAEVGYCVFNYDYPSSKCPIEEHTAIFLALFRKTLLAENITGRVFFLTHSMGGILLRAAMAQMTGAECRNIEAVVMLGPPNRGSIWAIFGQSKLAQCWNASLGDMALDKDSFVNTIPAPPFLPPIGIVAGRFDGKVAFANTSLPEGQPFKRITANCTHPGLRNPKHTLQPILRFFSRKEF